MKIFNYKLLEILSEEDRSGDDIGLNSRLWGANDAFQGELFASTQRC